MQFEIVIKNEKIKSYRTIAFILLLINISAFILMLFYDAFRYQAASAILLTTVYIIMRFYFTKKNQHGHYLDQVLMFVLAGCWLGLQNYYLMAGLIFIGIIYYLALQKIRILFTPTEVIKLNFPKKVYQWNMFNNVIVKDNMLTLDFKNNHLFQAEIELPKNLNEKEFNQFAHVQLIKTEVISSPIN